MSMLQTLLDPERRRKAAEDQEKFRATMGHRLARNSARSQYLYGIARERMALDQLAVIPDATNLHDESVDQLRAQLAEGLALQGRFDEAVEIAADSDPRREGYMARRDALAHVGELMCEHPLTRDNNGVAESVHLPVQKVWNGKFEIQFTRCLECNTISANA